jgi:translocation and assembly module TamA
MARSACAGIDVDIEGVSDALRDNVSAYLSLTRYKDRAVDSSTMDRLEERIVRETRAALEPFGYYGPTVRYRTTRLEKGAWNVRIDIDHGPPVIVRSVDVEVSGPGRHDPGFERIVDQPLLEPGDRLLHASYEQMKSELETTASAFGYFDARMVANELIVNPRKLTARIVLEMDTGERYRFGRTTLEQSVIDERLARRYLRYRRGDPYEQSRLLGTQFALDDSEYFSTVEVRPGTPDRVHRTVPVVIRARPNLRDRYSFSGGYGTDTGPRGTLQWDRTRIGRHGDRFGVQLEASKLLQVLQALYTIPVGDPAVDRLAFAATADYGIPGSLIDKDFALGPSYTRVVGRWQYVFSLMPTRSITYDGLTTETQDLLIPSVTVGSVPSGYLGQALFQQGFVAQLRAGVNLGGPSDQFVQLHVTGQHTFDLAHKWHLLLRGEAGVSLVSQLKDLPGSVRFFAGGEGSVRGFAYDDLSPIAQVAVPNGIAYLKVGGRDVLTGSIEVVRDVTRHIGIAAFSDAGNAFDTLGRSGNPVYPHFIEYSAGVGLLWRLPVLTLGVDVAQPISRPGAGPRFDVYFGPKL